MEWSEERVYSVSDLTFYIENLFENDENLTGVTVVGEVVDCRTRNGHLFFSLKDEQASIGCVMFGGVYMGIHLENGMMVQANGDVRIYPPKGQYRLVCRKLRHLPDRGLMFLKLKETYERLSKMGVFDKPKKQLPRFPSTIGVITSRDSAALQDILRTISKRFPFVKVVLYHTSVQGKGAKEEILKALYDANLDELDVVIIARGGGATEDLWLFNDEEVVMGVYALRHPVITGVGHQIDSVLVDLVADVAAHTPTAAAQSAVPDMREIIGNVERSLQACFTNIIRVWNLTKEYSDDLLLEMKRSVTKLLDDFENCSKQNLEKLKTLIGGKVDSLSRKLELAGARLNLLNPVAELERGYVIVEKDGVRVRSSRELSPGDVLMVRFHDGSVKVVVNEDRRADG
ncbi:hypothetical protein AS159_06440 [Thermotoga sp. Ku-13t]|uniref:exodeoxyribonuclease VII large subunit n=1 Tax=Thermotoga sp. Ku-13t TaxID=1755813 RepID=UPI0013EAA167|nr:exodeoxyribonuclease VII large subunit [Thermotoga sp. Ku-13t]KAF2958021.1 hypothetical protein AS159_06440 [Thermotoga sp. Ku-13t]